MKLGAKDFILKPFEDEILLGHIQKILLESLDDYKISLWFTENCNKLTLREKEILNLIIKGDANKEMSHKLGVTISTIKQHHAHIMHKMQVKSAIELAKNYSIIKKLGLI